MTIFLSFIGPQRILIQVRLESGTARGDISRQIAPGEDFFGYTYQELRDMGEGEHRIEKKSAA